MVAERGDTPPPKRSRGNRDRSCLGDRDHDSRRDRNDAKKNEDNFKCSVEKGVTGVRITVFSSAIVIDVIVHCHTAGALWSQTAENNCPYHRVVGF